MPRDEPRAPRPGGRRHSSVAWRALARSSNALQATGSRGTGDDDRARGPRRTDVLPVLGSTGSVASRMARRQAALQADAIEDFDHLAQSVLFLRAFTDDRAPVLPVRRPARPPTRQSGSSPSSGRDPDEEFLSFERYLGPELSRRVGPIIGLGSPDDRLPPEGPVTPALCRRRELDREGRAPRPSRALHRHAATDHRVAERRARHHPDSHTADKLFVITSPYAAAGEGQTGMLAPLRLRLGCAAARPDDAVAGPRCCIRHARADPAALPSRPGLRHRL